MSDHPARRLWATLETLHDVVYFAPSVRDAGVGLGPNRVSLSFTLVERLHNWISGSRPGPAARNTPEVIGVGIGFHPADYQLGTQRVYQ